MRPQRNRRDGSSLLDEDDALLEEPAVVDADARAVPSCSQRAHRSRSKLWPPASSSFRRSCVACVGRRSVARGRAAPSASSSSAKSIIATGRNCGSTTSSPKSSKYTSTAHADLDARPGRCRRGSRPSATPSSSSIEPDDVRDVEARDRRVVVDGVAVDGPASRRLDGVPIERAARRASGPGG